MVDTTIRLGHVGTRAYSWEEAGLDPRRFATFRYHLEDPHAAWKEPKLAALRAKFPWPAERPSVTPRPSEGWLSDSVKNLFKLHVSSKNKLIVELGAWLGLSTRYMAERARGAAIITIDHWRGGPEHVNDPAYAAMLPELYETFLANCWDHREQILPLRMSTLDGLDLVSRHGLAPDVCYIDADHSYPAVRADFEKVLDLFPGAVVLGDDFDWESVRLAVTDVARLRNLNVESDGVAWRYVPKEAGG